MLVTEWVTAEDLTAQQGAKLKKKNTGCSAAVLHLEDANHQCHYTD